MVITSFLDPIFFPFLYLEPGIALPLLAFLISLLLTIVYKYTTDQEQIKAMKAEMKELQKQMRQTKDTDEIMKKQKRVLEINMKLLGMTLKPTLITMIPILFVFAWISVHYAYVPPAPGVPFNVTLQGVRSNASFKAMEGITLVSQGSLQGSVMDFVLKAENAGSYLLVFNVDGKDYSRKVTVSERYGNYEPTEKKFDDLTIKVGMEPLKPYGSLSLFGWRPGWLGTYIIFSLVFSILLRKLLRVE
ncbi:MAG: EMC3/TMCO1 family protein [Candidatus Woesearchaeota archaeon]